CPDHGREPDQQGPPQGHAAAQGVASAAMVRRDAFLGGSTPFQGDRGLRLRSVPAGARIVRATATVIPFSAPDFRQELSFPDKTTFGATKTATSDFVEVDFHARRTLVRVDGTNLNGATLQADFGGGTYVNISQTGAFLNPPPDKPFTLTAAGGGILPGLAVAKVKLTAAGANPGGTSGASPHTPPNLNAPLRTPGPC